MNRLLLIGSIVLTLAGSSKAQNISIQVSSGISMPIGYCSAAAFDYSLAGNTYIRFSYSYNHLTYSSSKFPFTKELIDVSFLDMAVYMNLLAAGAKEVFVGAGAGRSFLHEWKEALSPKYNSTVLYDSYDVNTLFGTKMNVFENVFFNAEMRFVYFPIKNPKLIILTTCKECKTQQKTRKIFSSL